MNTIQNYGTSNYNMGFKASTVRVPKEWLTSKQWEQLADNFNRTKPNLHNPGEGKTLGERLMDSYPQLFTKHPIDLNNPDNNKTAKEVLIENISQAAGN